MPMGRRLPALMSLALFALPGCATAQARDPAGMDYRHG